MHTSAGTFNPGFFQQNDSDFENFSILNSFLFVFSEELILSLSRPSARLSLSILSFSTVEPIKTILEGVVPYSGKRQL